MSLPPLRPRTADRRRHRRLCVTLLTIVLIGTVGTTVSLMVAKDQVAAPATLETVGAVGVLAWMRCANRRDERRVDAWYLRVCGLPTDRDDDEAT